MIPLAWAATIVIALGLGYYAAGRGSKMEGAEPVAASSQVAVSPLPTASKERQVYIRSELEALGILDTEPHGW